MIPAHRRRLLCAGATALAAQFDANPVSSSFADYEFKIGYHTVTWGDNTEQAIDEISEIGFTGVAIRRP